MKRVIVYIDGFNLYHGLVAAGFRKYLWLDLNKLAKEILESDQVLTGVKYFTARTTLPIQLSSSDRIPISMLLKPSPALK